MNLTLDALEGVQTQVDALMKIEDIQKQTDLYLQISDIQKQVSGCLKLIDELIVAKESLEANGYSTEWMDIVNADNNFLTVVDLDMPKFFGGDEARQAACEGAIWETVKKWAITIWNWIMDLGKKLRMVTKFLLAFWIHNKNECKDLRKIMDDPFIKDITSMLDDPRLTECNNRLKQMKWLKRDPVTQQIYSLTMFVSILDTFLPKFAEFNTYTRQANIKNFLDNDNIFLFKDAKGETIQLTLSQQRDAVRFGLEPIFEEGSDPRKQKVIDGPTKNILSEAVSKIDMMQTLKAFCKINNFIPIMNNNYMEFNPEDIVAFMPVSDMYVSASECIHSDADKYAEFLFTASGELDKLISTKVKRVERILADLEAIAKNEKDAILRADKNGDTTVQRTMLNFVSKLHGVVAKTTRQIAVLSQATLTVSVEYTKITHNLKQIQEQINNQTK